MTATLTSETLAEVTSPSSPTVRLYDAWGPDDVDTVRVEYLACDGCGGDGRAEEGRCSGCLGFGQVVLAVGVEQ